MKKVLLSLCALGIAFASFAQVNPTTPQHSANVGMSPIRQGNWMVGGSVGNIGYSFESEAFGISLMPRAGYFVTDGIAIGAQVDLSLTAISGQDNAFNYGIAPFVRYYFPQGSSATGRFFGQGDIGIGGSNVGNDVSLLLGLNAGYAHFITQTVALEVMAGYNYRKADLSASSGQNGLGVSLGFQIYLPGQR